MTTIATLGRNYVLVFFIMYRVYILLIALCLSLPAFAGFYRWVDENGRVHYSDNIPPDQTAQGHRELDPEARPVLEVYPAKTPEQLKQEKLAALQAEQRSKESERQAALDRALIESFTSIDQIDALAKERLGTIDGKMQETQRKLQKVEARLKQTEKRKAWFRESGRPVPSQIRLNIKEYHHQIELYEKDLTRHMEKRKTTLAKLQQDKQRFIELQSELKQAEPAGEAAE